MILVNNAKSVCSHAFGCGKGNFEPLGKEDLHHQLMSTTALLVFVTTGHMDPHIIVLVTKSVPSALIDVVFITSEMKPASIFFQHFSI